MASCAATEKVAAQVRCRKEKFEIDDLYGLSLR